MLSLRLRSRGVVFGEWAAFALMLIPALGLLLMTAPPLLGGAPVQVWAWPLPYAFFSLWFLADDVRFLRLRDERRRAARLPRHLSRMAFAFAIAVHAPVVSFGDRWGIDPVLAFFGPFVLWPIIVFSTRATARTLTNEPSGSI